jgi:hypothetical protein
MPYYNYHATARQLLADGKLVRWYYTEKHNRVSPALVLVFDDAAHPVMPIREYRWPEYIPLLPVEKEKTD